VRLTGRLLRVPCFYTRVARLRHGCDVRSTYSRVMRVGIPRQRRRAQTVTLRKKRHGARRASGSHPARRDKGTHLRSRRPVYSDCGRMIRLDRCCSNACAIHPLTRLMAKVGVKSER
jgi:hypothetical protein